MMESPMTDLPRYDISIYGMEIDPDGSWIKGSDHDAYVADVSSRLQQLEQEKATLIAKLAIAEHHKALSLLGKSSWQEVVEEQLRIKFAESQIDNDQLRVACQALADLDWCIGYELTEANAIALDDARDLALRAIRPTSSESPVSPFDSGICCMAAHANATPPWTCSCECHTRKRSEDR